MYISIMTENFSRSVWGLSFVPDILFCNVHLGMYFVSPVPNLFLPVFSRVHVKHIGWNLCQASDNLSGLFCLVFSYEDLGVERLLQDDTNPIGVVLNEPQGSWFTIVLNEGLSTPPLLSSSLSLKRHDANGIKFFCSAMPTVLSYQVSQNLSG